MPRFSFTPDHFRLHFFVVDSLLLTTARGSRISKIADFIFRDEKCNLDSVMGRYRGCGRGCREMPSAVQSRFGFPIQEMFQ
jgi:hypothetical protein